VGGAGHLTIDRALTRDRIAAEIDQLSGPAYTSSESAICRYAYTPQYRETVGWFRRQFEALGFDVWEDRVGTFVAQNRPRGTPVFGLGSHCDSNRNGGRWDGTLGVVVALEVCRLAQTHDLDLPFRAISFLEEEGSGFGQVLLGSRICAQRVNEQELRSEFRAIDDGRTFWEHASEAGFEPERWRECVRVLDDLAGWIECHIEQGRVLQDAGRTVGVVEGIAGYVHGDIEITGRADHAGSTPMGLRVDALAAAAEIVLELERQAVAAGHGTVASVGELDVSPGFINVIPGNVRMSIDIRGIDEDVFGQIATDIARFAQAAARRRGGEATFRVRQKVSPVRMNETILQALEAAAAGSGEPHLRMISGAAHDTVCVADRAPSAMLFVPCRDGISHSPDEQADPADAALACELILNAVVLLSEATAERPREGPD
jgi:hydantoinase/carbamoylase family amidase